MVALPVLLLASLGVIATIVAGEGDAGPLALASVAPGLTIAVRRNLAGGRRPSPSATVRATTPGGWGTAVVLVRLVAGGTIANALLRLPTGLATRLPTAVAVAVAVVLAVAALIGAPRRVRRIGVAVGVVLVGLAGAGAAGAALVARAARTTAEQGIDAARGALTAARSGDAVVASSGFQQAAALLRTANQELRSPRAVFGRFLPVVAPNLRAARELTGAGADVASRAASAVAAVDFSGLREPDGRIDVERIAALRTPVSEARDAVERALVSLDAINGPWTAGAIRTQALSLRKELVTARLSSGDAAAVLDALPDLLGRSGPRRYLIVVPTPAEARGSGGLIGNYGEITVDDGRIELSRFGRTIELNQNGIPGPQRVLVAPADYLRRYAPFEVSRLWQNVTLSPDFPSSAEAMASLYPQSGGSEIDGVISADPFALAAILRLTGSITLEGWPQPITAENAPTTLLHDWYSQLTEARNRERIDLQGRVASEAWSRLLHLPLPALQTLASTFAAPARDRHLQLWAKRAPEQAFFRQIRVDGAMGPLAGDGFAAVTNNAGANKIEWYLHRTISYDATVDLTAGTVRAIATIDMQNDAPASGEARYLIGNAAAPPAPDGTSVQYLSLYSPLQLRHASFDGVPLETTSDTELGRNVYSAWIRIPPGGHGVVSAEFEGTLPGVAKTGYSVEIGCQALVNPDEARVRIRVTGRQPTTVLNLAASDGSFGASEPVTCRRRYELRLAGK